MNPLIGDLNTSLDTLKKESGWLLLLGVCLIILGGIAIVYEMLSTIASIFALGSVLIVAGLFQLYAAFRSRGAGHVILYLLIGALDVVVGLAVFEHPLAGALIVTLTLAIYLIFSGIFRVFYSLWAQLPQYAWSVFSGLLAVLLGFLLWYQWPTSALWFLGFAVGVNFIFAGVAWVMFAMKLREGATVVRSAV